VLLHDGSPVSKLLLMPKARDRTRGLRKRVGVERVGKMPDQRSPCPSSNAILACIVSYSLGEAIRKLGTSAIAEFSTRLVDDRQRSRGSPRPPPPPRQRSALHRVRALRFAPVLAPPETEHDEVPGEYDVYSA
jgi:hypothetical protein